MTLNILFFTISIKKNKMTQQEAYHQEMVEKLYEQHKDRQISMYHQMQYFLKEVIYMTLNILFFTITIKKRKKSFEEARHQEMVEKLYEQHKDRQISMQRMMQQVKINVKKGGFHDDFSNAGKRSKLVGYEGYHLVEINDRR